MSDEQRGAGPRRGAPGPDDDTSGARRPRTGDGVDARARPLRRGAQGEADQPGTPRAGAALHEAARPETAQAEGAPAEPAYRPARAGASRASDEPQAPRARFAASPTPATDHSQFTRPADEPVRGPRHAGAEVPTRDNQAPRTPARTGAHAAAPATRRGSAIRLLAPLLALALLIGGGALWWRSHRGTDAPATPVASPSGPVRTPSAVDGTPIPEAVEMPGPGTVAAVLAHLKASGFVCDKENQPGMDSWTCTHYTADPTIMAYVGGATDHRLGRVALNVQDGNRPHSPMALALQQRLVGQALTDPKERTRMLTEVRAGTDERYAVAVEGPVVARGSADGSIVMFVKNWVPDRAVPAELLPAKPLGPALAAMGYRCAGTDKVSCSRSVGAVTHAVDYTTDEYQVDYLKIKTSTTGTAPVAAAAAAEVRSVTALFQQGKQVQAWLKAHGDEPAGATGYAEGGLALDWYPGASQADRSAVFYLRQACWTDTVEPC